MEEQFYLLWPLAATIALRRLRSSRWLLAISGSGFVLSVSLMAGLSLAGVGADRLYYGSDTRAQALFVGDALAGIVFAMGRDFTGRPFRARRTLRHVREEASWSSRMRSAMGAAGAAVLTFVLVRVDGHSAWLYCGGFGIVALAVAAVIASLVLQPRSWLARVASWRPLVALGVISYGVYLWHWPVIVMLTPARTGLSGTELLFARLGLTLVVSIGSFHLLERPIREQRWHIPRPVIAVTAAFAGIVILSITAPFTFMPTTALAAVRVASQLPVASNALTTSVKPSAPVAASIATAPTAPRPTVPAIVLTGPLRLMVVGDSVAPRWGREPRRYRVRPGSCSPTRATSGAVSPEGEPPASRPTRRPPPA